MSVAGKVLCYTLGVLFVGAGLNHFLQPALYLNIMPPYLPWHRFLVYLSGVFEVVLGVGVVLPASRRWAAWALILLLIAVFPANVYMAQHAALFPNVPVWALWLRLPLQGVLIAWAYAYTRPRRT
ncbi:Uncharacterized membrane protein [Catalinimonas alkaloidigena]|uniref:Uncharacterized membrane protein n=1 Tax=Catalinimonas alkaloidigena TaxID=1075417 RepID=A0A1G9DGC1_9BACT|nr:MauE/DoxX family redox-associated membrane protein [Catalinimonas alkaloidigena]SDK62902.1 Uncharacterized membrane protein [Catalinimonas alkaloidigena]